MAPRRQANTNRTAGGAGGAFTLLELLIIMAIIACLIGVMIPSFLGARDLANFVQCQNNHRQLIQGVANYMCENNDYYTFPNWLWPETSGWWTDPGWLYDITNLQNGHGTFVLKDLEGGALWKYLGRYDTYRCPAEAEPYTRGSSNHITSYLMNGAVTNYGHYPHGKVVLYRMMDMLRQQGTEAVLIWEAHEDWGSYWNDGSSTPNQGLTDRHGDGATVGMMDGHTDWISLDDYDAELARRPGRLWCNPGAKDGRYQFND